MILSRLGRSRKVSTQMLPIGGGRGFPVDGKAREAWLSGRAGRSGLPVARVSALLARYGTTADAVLAHIAAVGDAPLAHVEGYGRAEIDWIARNEMVRHLADIVMRRTTLAIEGGLTAAGIGEIAGVAAAALGWSDERREKEIAAVTAHLARFNRVAL
jgi:glycerol-3-phosphate dehydrogenase